MQAFTRNSSGITERSQNDFRLPFITVLPQTKYKFGACSIAAKSQRRYGKDFSLLERQGCTASMTSATPDAPTCTGPVCPIKSPVWGMAWPERDTRACSNTVF